METELYLEDWMETKGMQWLTLSEWWVREEWWL